MKFLTALCLLCMFALSGSQTTDCKPGQNCSPPDCRCWNDRSVPGGIALEDTPQVVMVTFEYAVNDANAELYSSLFEDTVNPNNCPAVGTFFVQETNSNLGVIKNLHDNGHEIGVTSIDGTLPGNRQKWRNDIDRVRDILVAIGIPEDEVVGVRAPQLQPGGVDEFMAILQEGFLYDASCITATFDEQSLLLWPYTYDFAPGPTCEGGESPEAIFPGKWQVMLPDLQFNGTKCATPSACTDVATQRDAFDLFYNSFIQHYEGNRSPLMVAINPEWVLTDYKRLGTIQFLQYIRSAFPDTWVLSVRQALDWVRQPVPNANATVDYPPWACN